MFVSAIEALAVPNAPWHRRRLSKRFAVFTLQVCPDAIAKTLEHANFEQAFGKIKSGKRLVEDLYDRRSRPLHTGFLQHNATGMLRLGGDAGIRVVLVADIVRAALRSFIGSPDSMLVGHPAIDPDPGGTAVAEAAP